MHRLESRAQAGTAAEAEPAAVSCRRSLATVRLVVFIDLLGFEVLIPVLPFHIQKLTLLYRDR